MKSESYLIPVRLLAVYIIIFYIVKIHLHLKAQQSTD